MLSGLEVVLISADPNKIVATTFTWSYVRLRDLEVGLVPTYAYTNRQIELQCDMFWLNVAVCSNSDFFSFISFSQVIDICLQKWKNFLNFILRRQTRNHA